MKVFGIGLNKTGTKTLRLCFEHFGFRHTSVNRELTHCVDRGELERVFEFAERYDSFEDWPWPLIYRQLDARFPGSKFILTTRESADKWLRSLKRHAPLTRTTECRQIAYGYPMPHGHEVEHRAIYEHHNRAVREYFRHRRGDFLEVCWEAGDGWKELCGFLGQEIPDIPFPHANPGSRKRRRLFRWSMQRMFRAATFSRSDG